MTGLDAKDIARAVLALTYPAPTRIDPRAAVDRFAVIQPPHDVMIDDAAMGEALKQRSRDYDAQTQLHKNLYPGLPGTVVDDEPTDRLL